MGSKSKSKKLFCFATGEPFQWDEKQTLLPAKCVGCEAVKGNCNKIMQQRVRKNVARLQPELFDGWGYW